MRWCSRGAGWSWPAHGPRVPRLRRPPPRLVCFHRSTHGMRACIYATAGGCGLVTVVDAAARSRLTRRGRALCEIARPRVLFMAGLPLLASRLHGCAALRSARETFPQESLLHGPSLVPCPAHATSAHAARFLTGVRAMADRDRPSEGGRRGRGLGGRSHPPCLSFSGLLTLGAPERSSSPRWLSACACVVLSTYGQRPIEVVATRATGFGGRSDRAEEARPMMQAVQGTERGGVREPR